MMKFLTKLLLIASSFYLSTFQAHAALITSTFDLNNEGWRLSGDAKTSNARYSSSGFIYGDDKAAGGLWYFEAPEKFRGNLAGAFNQLFSFDLNYTGSGSTLSGGNMLTIFGNSSAITISAPVPSPRGSWKSYSFQFNETANWRTGGVQASNYDIKNVLSNVTRIRIRGEYVNGSDRGKLDNVSVNVVPEPLSSSLFGLGILALFAYRARYK